MLSGPLLLEMVDDIKVEQKDWCESTSILSILIGLIICLYWSHLDFPETMSKKWLKCLNLYYYILEIKKNRFALKFINVGWTKGGFNNYLGSLQKRGKL